jgi:hypothetical protein
MERVYFTITKAVRGNSTLWAGTIFAAYTKELFRVAAEKASKEGVTTVEVSIPKRHLNTFNTSRSKELCNSCNTCMVEVGNCSAPASNAVNVL